MARERSRSIFFLGEGLGAVTSRRMLPLVIIPPIALGALTQMGLRQGFLDHNSAFVLISVLFVLISFGMLAVASRRLDNLDLKRQETAMREQAILRDLRQSEERYRVLTEVANHNIWEADANGALTYANRWWIEYCGQPLDQTLNDSWLQFVRPDERESVIGVWENAVRTQTPYEIGMHFRRASDGEYRYHLVRGLPQFDPSGKVQKWVGMAIDIHEIKQARDELREALLVRDAFLSMASHELKTPLTSLRLQCQFLIQLLRGGDSGAFARNRVEFMADQTNQQVGRLIRLVNDMLDVARIRTGRLSILRERFDMGALISDCVSRLAPQAEVERAHDVIGNWDRLRIDQVLSNLVSNAVKYGGGKPIKVRIEKVGETVRVTVRDYGKGISLEDQQRIFGRFQRLPDNDGISGLGLGLFISKQIVLAHGGNLWVESELGQGSSFHFELPLGRVVSGETGQEENVDVTGNTPAPSGIGP